MPLSAVILNMHLKFGIQLVMFTLIGLRKYKKCLRDVQYRSKAYLPDLYT